jgi:N-acetylglucosaminyl-diphospho-decaprenol L-rhamnosyltransferase
MPSVPDESGLMLSIDVVIPTYNRWELTKGCLKHLRTQTVPHTVIVSDNASRDGTVDRIRAGFPEVRIVETGGNLGFAVACNQGVAAGTSEIVVLLNNDVDCRPDFLERLVAPFEDSQVGSVAALLVEPNGERIDNVGLAADATLAGFARLAGRPASDAALPEPVLVGPSGGAGAYRRSAWVTAGGLDARIFSYMEDLDLALRLRIAGWKARAAPEAVGVHLGSATFGRRSARQRFESGFARAYLLRRYGVLRTPVVLRAVLTEVIVVTADWVVSRDLDAVRGRVAGWRSADGLPRLPLPPPDAIDARITFLRSLRLRRRVLTAPASV